MTYIELTGLIEHAELNDRTERANVLRKLIPGITDPDARTMNQADAAYLTPWEVVELDKMGWKLSGINSF